MLTERKKLEEFSTLVLTAQTPEETELLMCLAKERLCLAYDDSKKGRGQATLQLVPREEVQHFTPAQEKIVRIEALARKRKNDGLQTIVTRVERGSFEEVQQAPEILAKLNQEFVNDVLQVLSLGIDK